MSGHTPGPWRMGNGCVVSDSAEGLTIAGATEPEYTAAYGGNLICESVEPANARLIAAAPELLEALRGMVAQVERAAGMGIRYIGVGDALAAIAKAEGR